MITEAVTPPAFSKLAFRILLMCFSHLLYLILYLSMACVRFLHRKPLNDPLNACLGIDVAKVGSY